MSQPVTSYSKQVVSSFLWQGGAQAVGQAAAWLATIVVIRLLATEDYGLMALANVFLGFFFFFADWGFGAAAVQARSVERDDLRRMFGIVLLTNVGGFLLTFAAAPFVADFYKEPRLIPIVRALSVNFLLLSAYVLPQSQLVRDMDFKTKGRVEVSSTIISALAGLSLAAAGAGVWALVATSVSLHLVKAVAYNAVRPLALTPLFSLRPILAMARFGIAVTAGRFLYFLFAQVDVMIGGKLLGTDAIGVYAIALSLAAIPMEKVLPVITQVSFAAYARIQADAERVRRNLLRSVQLVSLVCFPAFVGMAAVGADLVPVVLGESKAELTVPFQLLCLVLPFKAISVLFSPALFGVGRPGVYVGTILVALATMATAMLIGARDGVVGMCVAWLVAYPPVFLFMSWRSLRALGVPYSRFAAQCAFPFVASVAMGICVIGTREALAPMGASPARLALEVALGVVLYSGMTWVFQRRAIGELVAVVRS